MRDWTSSSEVDELCDPEELSTTELHAILSEKEFLPDLIAYWERVNLDSERNLDPKKYMHPARPIILQHFPNIKKYTFMQPKLIVQEDNIKRKRKNRATLSFLVSW